MNSVTAIKKSCWTIFKLIFPIYIVVDILHYLGALSLVSQLFAPLTELLGLPAEAALALAGGGLFNLYTGIALASPLDLSPQQWTVVSVFLGLFHSIIIEAAVLKKLKVPVWMTVTIRLSAAILCSFIVSKFQSGSSQEVTNQVISLTHYDSFSEMLISSVTNAALITFKVMILIALIIYVFDLIKKSAFFGKKVAGHSWVFNLAVGLLLGVTYGAGLLLNEEASNSRSNVPLAFFLLLCHGIIEETLLFTMFGASATPVILSRFITALGLSLFCYVLIQYKAKELKPLTEETV